jgi:hypothetical protein
VPADNGGAFEQHAVKELADYFLDGHAKTDQLWSLQNRPLWVACRLLIASQPIRLNCMVDGQDNSVEFFIYAVL